MAKTTLPVHVLEIQNFKSIRELRIHCRRVNVFIGRPNTGKSNILEALGLLSLVYEPDLLFRRLVRFENMTDLFFDREISQEVRVSVGVAGYTLSYHAGQFLGAQSGMFLISGTLKDESSKIRGQLNILGTGQVSVEGPRFRWPFKFYRFVPVARWDRPEPDFLLPPYGENLLAVLQTHREVRQWVAGLFSDFGYKLVLKPHEGRIEFQKEVEGVVYAFPYHLASDTLQRTVLYGVAVETNRGSVLLMEEPEAHAFPFYTKYLAERIARDTSNQYFLSTHNPYFLLTLVEKTPRSDLTVFWTDWKDYQTRVRPLKESELQEVLELDIDVFFNLDRFQAGR